MALQMQPLKVPKPLGYPKLVVNDQGTVLLALDDDQMEGTIEGVVLATSNTQFDVGNIVDLEACRFKDLPIGETVTLFNKGD